MTSGDDARARQVAQEDEKDGDHEPDADHKVVKDVVGRHVDEVRPLIEDLDPHASAATVSRARSPSFSRRRPRHVGRDFSYLRIMHDAFDDVILGAAAHDPLAGLVADDDLGHLADVDGRAIGRRGNDHVPDVVELLGFDLDRLADVRRVERVFASAQESDGAHVMRLGAQREDVAADVGVRAGDRFLDLRHRHVVLLQEPGVQEHLILLDRPAVTGHVDHARNLLEERVQNPVLYGFKLICRVSRAPRERSERSRRSGSRERGAA